MFGKSDPYVRVLFDSGLPESDGVTEIGRTSVQQNTINPV
jgi:hypothetical protein